jgi:hypothetical protein
VASSGAKENFYKAGNSIMLSFLLSIKWDHADLSESIPSVLPRFGFEI